MRAGLPLGGIGLAIICGVAGVAWFSQPAPRNEESLCLLPSSASIITESGLDVLVVDKTDKWNSAQEARMRNLVLRLRDQLAVNERLSIFVFDNAVPQGFQPVFSLCNPGRASDTTFWVSNPRRWEKRFNESFGRPLDDILEDLTRAGEGPVSPILEVLIDLTNREELNTGNIRRRVILVSDMLQNSDAYTFFPPRPAPPPATERRTESMPPMGGPLVLLPHTPPGGAPKPRQLLGRQPVSGPRQLSAKDIEEMVEMRGGLRHLNKFRMEVYQVRGVYKEDRLIDAREFWDQIARQYGVEIDWKVL